MSDIIGRLIEKLKVSSTSTIPEIQFLEQSDLCSALNRGFIELYHTQFIELYHTNQKIQYYLIKISSKRIKSKRLKKN